MRGIQKVCFAIAVLFAMVALGKSEASAQDSPPSFAGKTITIYVGFAAGGAAALASNLVAQYLGNHIPGNPKVIVAYKPGAGSLTLADYMYNIAPRTGLEIGRVATNMAYANLLGDPGVQFQADKFNWVAASGSFEWVLMIASASKYGSLDAIRKSSVPPHLGASGPLHYTSTIARFMEDALGTKFDIIQGYPGEADVRLAITRGEVDGGITSYRAFIQNKADASFGAGTIGVPIQSGRGAGHVALPGLESVPTIWSLAAPEKQDLLRLLSPYWTDPYVLPPGTPAPIVKTLQAAFASLAQDKEFLPQFEKVTGDEYRFTSGDDILQDVVKFQNASPATVQELKTLSTAQ